MSFFKITVIAIMALLLQGATSQQDTLQNVYPASVIIGSEVAGVQDDNCVPLTNPDTGLASDAEHVHCQPSTRITNSDRSQPIFTQDTHNEVYVWPSGSDRVLFSFSSLKMIDSITIHYFSDEDNQGFPKLIFYAVPNDFEIGDTVDFSYPTRVIDSITPGNEGTGLRNKTTNTQFNTTKILMKKGFTRNYQFYASEIEFFTSDPESMDEVVISTSTTAAPSTETATTTAATTQATTTGEILSFTETVEDTTTTAVAESTEQKIIVTIRGVEVNIGGLVSSGAGRVQSQVSHLCLLVLTLFGALMMLT